MLSRLLKEHQARQSERRELQGEPAPPSPWQPALPLAGGAATHCGRAFHWSVALSAKAEVGGDSRGVVARWSVMSPSHALTSRSAPLAGLGGPAGPSRPRPPRAERRRKDAIAAATRLTEALVDHLNVG